MSAKPLPRSIWSNPIQFIATGFGSGALPYAPGTWGTVMGVPLYLLLHEFSLLTYVVITVLGFVAGIYICGKADKDFGTKDNPGIVWDEIIGYWITMLAVPFSWTAVILGFILFRIFDITKPPPIAWADKQVSGGLGVMLDDVIAAVYAGAILAIIMFVLP